MVETNVTEDDLLALLQREAVGEPGRDGSLTRREIQEKTGWGKNKTLKILRMLVQDGSVIVRRVPRVNIVGDSHSPPGYRLDGEDSEKGS